MALLWQKTVNGNHYEVRSAGRTRRLYTNGICHSDYQPGRAVSRSIWDCLFLPLLMRPPAAVRRVLVLGVGGGSVIHLLQQHLPRAELVGVELSSIHLEVAERFFGLRDVELHEAEAASWLQAYDGPAFDAIIDDLFLEEGSEARRAIEPDAAWLRTLLKPLAAGGVMTLNMADIDELRRCGWQTERGLRRLLPQAHVLRTPLLHNVVAAFFRDSSDTRLLSRRLQQVPALARAHRRGDLRYSMRRLKSPD